MDRYDVVVVGAGPAGSSAARFASAGGARTLLVDQREMLGAPVQCGEFLPAPHELVDLLGCRSVIEEAYRIPPETVLRRTSTMACVSPYGHRYTFPLEGMSVSRRAFDQALASDAQKAGAELRYPAGVTKVRDEVVEFARGPSASGKVIIGADGPVSTVARGFGFAPERELFRMITASVQGSFPPEIALYFGRVAPGGYAWVIPKDGEANVGLGVTHLPSGQGLSALLDRFLAKEHLGPAKERTRWWVPVGAPPESAVRGRAMFCGDAANLVMATNGAGIPSAMLSGRDAGVVAAAHVADGTPLAEYDRLLAEHLNGPLARAHRVKEFGDRVVGNDLLLALGMRYIGSKGLDSMMRLRWPSRLRGNS
ncbi:MAG: geranylgeranyl reductase family protein [Thermoplasmata archaeon]|nr:geranylgeranyl reductase family protein [Thermoplasmata archaeon]